MLYHYCGDKEGLYVEVLRTVYARMEAAEMVALPPDCTTEQAIRAVIARHLLVLMMGMCFIYFSDRHTLLRAVGLDADRPQVRSRGLRLAQDAFLAAVGLRRRG